MYILKIKSRQILKTFILVKKRINFWDSSNSLIMRSCYHHDHSGIYVERLAFPSRFTYPFLFCRFNMLQLDVSQVPNNARSHNGPLAKNKQNSSILWWRHRCYSGSNRGLSPCPLPVAATVTERCISASFGQFQTGRAPAVRWTISCDGPKKLDGPKVWGWFLLSKFANSFVWYPKFWGIFEA